MKIIFQILEYVNKCPALICPRCTSSLKQAYDFRNSIILSNTRFKQIYKQCHYRDEDEEIVVAEIVDDVEFEITFKSEPVDEKEVNALRNDFEDIIAPENEDYRALKAEVFIDAENIKQEPQDQDPFGMTCQETADIDDFLQNAIKEESIADNNEFQFDDLSDDLLMVLDDDNNEFGDGSSEDEEQQSTVETFIPLDLQKPHPEVKKKRGRKASLPSFICTLCGYKSCSELDRQEHIATLHFPKKRKRTYVHVISDRDWMCSYCGKYFRTKYESIQHRRTEHKEE